MYCNLDKLGWALAPGLIVGMAASVTAQVVPEDLFPQTTHSPPVMPQPMMVGQLNGHPLFCFPETGPESSPQGGYCVAILPFPDGSQSAIEGMELFVNLQVRAINPYFGPAFSQHFPSAQRIEIPSVLENELENRQSGAVNESPQRPSGVFRRFGRPTPERVEPLW